MSECVCGSYIDVASSINCNILWRVERRLRGGGRDTGREGEEGQICGRGMKEKRWIQHTTERWIQHTTEGGGGEATFGAKRHRHGLRSQENTDIDQEVTDMDSDSDADSEKDRDTDTETDTKDRHRHRQRYTTEGSILPKGKGVRFRFRIRIRYWFRCRYT